MVEIEPQEALMTLGPDWDDRLHCDLRAIPETTGRFRIDTRRIGVHSVFKEGIWQFDFSAEDVVVWKQKAVMFEMLIDKKEVEEDLLNKPSTG